MTLSPRPPRYINFFEPFHFLAGDQLVVPIGVFAHFFTATRNTIEGVGEKEQTNNTSLGLTQSARQGVMQYSAFPVCLCRLTLAWISSETSTKLLGMPTYPDRYSSLLWTLSRCQLISLLSGSYWSLASPFTNCLPRALLSNSLTSVPLTTSGHPRSRVQNPLFGFAPKQTMESSAWWTTYIVLH